LEGNALYGSCLNTAHIFFVTQSIPKTRVTIHPMGAAAVGRHPFRPLNLIRPDATVEPPLTGPYSLEIVIPPDTVFEADSGWIELGFDGVGRLRGRMEAWVQGKAGTGPNRVSLPQRRFTGRFTAVRDRSLEPSLTHGTECARE
jgi:hypothetical protein